MRSLLLFAIAAIGVLPARPARGQATCIDTTGDMCLNVIRAARTDGVIDDIFVTSDGRFAPQLNFGTYIRGVNGCVGGTFEPRILSGYSCRAALPGEDIGGLYANSLDWQWTQVLRTRDDGSVVADGEPGYYVPWRARIYDLGGEANRVVLFPITDHAPLPCEAFEYTVWLSNDPDATEIAPPGSADSRMWNEARLIRVFTQGWTRNHRATGAAEAARADLATWLRDNSMGEAVADALVTVWALPCGLSFRYVAINAGNDGNPGPECVFHSSDDELDAVAGLNEDDTVICVDADGDGHRDAACGGGDCDDSDATVHPGAFEPCDATTDFDCRPAQPCPTGTVCDTDSGLCVPQCFEGGCATGFVCIGDRCVDEGCSMLAEPCPSGTLCRGGECRAPCDGVICPADRVCEGGACIDPCAGVVCPTNQVCVAADPAATTVCGPSCACTELAEPLCAADRACDDRMGSATMGRCVDPGCETAICAETVETCVDGACVDACEGVICPLGQTCASGECIPDLCSRIICPTGQVCREGACFDACDMVTCGVDLICRDGACVPDPCAGTDCGDGFRCVEGMCIPLPGTDAGPTTTDAGTGGPTGPTGDSSCACRATGHPGPSPLPFALATILMGWLARRRRR
jgi:MYXO-CTERM domain-containing protein